MSAVAADRQTWEDGADKLRAGEMPPKKSPQPPREQVAAVLGWTEQTLAALDRAAPRDPGFVPIHRLNRAEYDNTIRDLVGVDFQPAADFPADDSGYGFDNIADVLSMSPLLAEKYLAAAEQVMDKAIVTDNPFKSRRVRVEAAKMSGGEAMTFGRRILYTNGDITYPCAFVTDADYVIRINAEADQAGDEPAKMIVRLDGTDLQTFEVKNRRGRPKDFELHVKAPKGEHQIAAAFINDYYNPEAPKPKDRDRNLILSWIEVEGPLDAPLPPPSDVQRRLLFRVPATDADAEACAADVLRAFTTRAFRRPSTDDQVHRLLKLYQQSRADGESYEQACKVAMEAVLVSPQFLYRIELDPQDHPRQPHPLNDYELATRLSYFLWSSMPDDELLSLAGQDVLHHPAVLSAQVTRMLADAKSSAFVQNFAGQWLELRNLDRVNPDPTKFPEFVPQLRSDMRREAELFFTHVLRDDASVLDLLDAKYTFLNERLAKFYGIEDVSGEGFRRVELSGEAAMRRGGVLTMAGVLTVTGMPTRTSPVKRGKYILDDILGTPSPPPPPDVPPLEKQDNPNAPLRQRLEDHRTNPTCASCHARMDPLGFALENYDAIGRWRTIDGKFTIDANGNLPSGESFDGIAGLKRVLLDHKDQFVQCLVQKMSVYALGRGLDVYDRPGIREICQKVKRSDYRMFSVIDGIVHSDGFLKRRGKI